MQSREFQRIGETAARRFGGKVIAATHRNLDEEIAAGCFYDDFYQPDSPGRSYAGLSGT